MPWSNNNGGPKGSGPRGSGPWGGGGNGGGPWGGGGGGGGRRGGGGQGPNIDDFFKKGQDQLKNVFGEGGGSGGGFGILLALLVAAGAWIYSSAYTVKPEEKMVVLTFGKYTTTRGPGFSFVPWPVQTAIKERVTSERVIQIGSDRSNEARIGANGQRLDDSRLTRRSIATDGVMLTGDENIIDISFQVAWNISTLENFLFKLADPDVTIRAVAESAMREVVGRSELLPLLNRDRAQLEDDVLELIQKTLNEYEAGVNIVRVTLDRADPPPQVIDSFRDVQAAAQERDTLLKRAQADYNKKVAAARGQAAQLRQQAEAYRARVIADAQGAASRFLAVLSEYKNAEEVTRQRLYIETMERVYGGMNKIIIDESAEGGSGVVPYLPLNELNRRQGASGSAQ